ncbi:MAG: hypothetical protein HYX34_01490 [Actinobacteria bacterium]|nr:hypothetical protein [Actinomycetota bacterium]
MPAFTGRHRRVRATTAGPRAAAVDDVVDDARPDLADPAESVWAVLARGVPLILAGWALGGASTAALALAAVVATWRRPSALAAGIAALLVALAGVLTVLERPLGRGRLGVDYATARPVAGATGRAAAVFLLVAVVTEGVRQARCARHRDAVGAGASPR